MADILVRDFYKILLISQTGKGKTYSFRNMDRAKTGFINAENKPLPFAGNFKYHAKPKAFAGVMKALEDYNNNPEIEVIVLDSISAAFEILVTEMRNNFTGWDIWNNYNKQVGHLLEAIKKAGKEVFVTGHYEILNIEGAPEKRLKVKGKEYEGTIEKDFTIVMYGNVTFVNGKPKEYLFKLAGEGESSKCPPAIFGEDVYGIENDSKIILDKIVAFSMQSASMERDIFA